MPAGIIPFPARRRVRFIERHAARMAETPKASTAEKLLQHELRRQRDVMERRGIDDETINREIGALESAIRAQVWRTVMQPGGAA